MPSYPKTSLINFSPTHSTWNSSRGSQPIQISAPNLCGGAALKSHLLPIMLSPSKLNTDPFSRMRFFVRWLALLVGLIIIVSFLIMRLVYHTRWDICRPTSKGFYHFLAPTVHGSLPRFANDGCHAATLGRDLAPAAPIHSSVPHGLAPCVALLALLVRFSLL